MWEPVSGNPVYQDLAASGGPDGQLRWVQCSHGVSCESERETSKVSLILARKILYRVLRLAVSIVLIIAAAASLQAQDAASPKFTLFAGPGILATQGHSVGEFQSGASFDMAPPGAWGGFSF